MDAVYVLIALAYVVIWVGTAVICWLKGKRLWATLGFVTGWHVIPAIRLAKPESRWAQKHYDGEKLDRAKARFGHGVPEHVAGGDYNELAELTAEEVAGMDKITKRAWEKERKRRALR